MNNEDVMGVISHDNLPWLVDYLFRVSLKCLIQNNKGEVLVVKESGRADYGWDIPGGGIDHEEAIKDALARELREEVNLSGDFSYKIIAVDEPSFVKLSKVWQIRLIFQVKPTHMVFTTGSDAEEISFIDPIDFENSEFLSEQKIFNYSHASS